AAVGDPDFGADREILHRRLDQLFGPGLTVDIDRCCALVKNWDHVILDDGLLPSETASAVKDWIERLKLDPEAALNRSSPSEGLVLDLSTARSYRRVRPIALNIWAFTFRLVVSLYPRSWYRLNYGGLSRRREFGRLPNRCPYILHQA